MKSVKELARGWWHGGGSEGQEYDGTSEHMNISAKFTILSNDALRKKCLQHYLSEYITSLQQGSLPQSASVDEVVDCMCHIYGCIEELMLHDGKKRSEIWKWHARDVSSIQIKSILC